MGICICVQVPKEAKTGVMGCKLSPVWVLGTKRVSFARTVAVSTLICRATSPVPVVRFLFLLLLLFYFGLFLQVLTMHPWLVLNSQRFACLSLPSSEIKGIATMPSL